MSNEFYRRVKKERQLRGLTLRQVSEKTGVSIGHLSEYERGKTKIEAEKLVKICRAIGIEWGTVSAAEIKTTPRVFIDELLNKKSEQELKALIAQLLREEAEKMSSGVSH